MALGMDLTTFYLHTKVKLKKFDNVLILKEELNNKLSSSFMHKSYYFLLFFISIESKEGIQWAKTNKTGQ